MQLLMANPNSMGFLPNGDLTLVPNHDKFTGIFITELKLDLFGLKIFNVRLNVVFFPFF